MYIVFDQTLIELLYPKNFIQRNNINCVILFDNFKRSFSLHWSWPVVTLDAYPLPRLQIGLAHFAAYKLRGAKLITL